MLLSIKYWHGLIHNAYLKWMSEVVKYLNFTPICFVGGSCFTYVICIRLVFHIRWCSCLLAVTDGCRMWSRYCLPLRGTQVHPRLFLWGLCCSIFKFLCSVLMVIICSSVCSFGRCAVSLSSIHGFWLPPFSIFWLPPLSIFWLSPLVSSGYSPLVSSGYPL
jgi:hypothetical protein